MNSRSPAVGSQKLFDSVPTPAGPTDHFPRKPTSLTAMVQPRRPEDIIFGMNTAPVTAAPRTLLARLSELPRRPERAFNSGSVFLKQQLKVNWFN